MLLPKFTSHYVNKNVSRIPSDTQKRTVETLRIQARISKRGALELKKRSKIEPGRPKEAPWELQDASRCSKRRPEAHKCAKETLQETLWEAQGDPRGTQESPGRLQEASLRPRVRSKATQNRSKMRFEAPKMKENKDVEKPCFS